MKIRTTFRFLIIFFLVLLSQMSGLKAMGEEEPLPDLEIQQKKLGNIFLKNESSAFTVRTGGDNVTWTVVDFWGNNVASGTKKVTDGKAELTLWLNKLGYFTLKLAATKNGELLAQKETPFARLTPFDVTALSDSQFGMSTHFSSTLRPAWNPVLMPLLQIAGAKNFRDEMYWDRVETQKGVYSFMDRYTNYMNEANAHQLNPLMIFSYTNPFYDNGYTPYTDEGRQGFANYGRSILEQYGEQIKRVEVYNEFNNPAFGDIGSGPADSRADYYFKLLKKTQETVKEIRPDVTVVGGASSAIHMGWLEDLFEVGGLDYMDVLSVHPYRLTQNPEGMSAELKALNELVKRYNGGQTKPIWITEMGYTTGGTKAVDEKTQAAYLVRMYVLSLAEGVEKIYWYDFMDDGLDKAKIEDNFGIIRHGDDALGAYTPKPAYVAYSAMTRQLTDAVFEKKEEIAAGVHSYKFKKGYSTVRALWSETPQDVTIRTDCSLTVTDIMGQSKTVYPKNGRVYLALTGNAVYVKGNIYKIESGRR
ncbi:glycosyl hydrolase [Bacillus gobiensis]|uniref:glycosyl hydrolase n=1 Tax=Bacillus gobiensis TaxID=1441095 RepID=UPI003D19F701